MLCDYVPLLHSVVPIELGVVDGSLYHNMLLCADVHV